MEMKRGQQNREKKELSAKGLISKARNFFKSVTTKPKKKTGLPRQIDLVDSLSSALAMFSLKCPSLLSFDKASNNKVIAHNLKTLYEIKQVPSDTYMREELDEVDPSELRGVFKEIFESVQRSKLLEQYKFLDKTYLVSVDGTGLFESKKIHCNDCCIKEHRDGKKTYYRQSLAGVIVHPGMPQVIPLCPEIISKQDGAKKNDCERRALQRFLKSLKEDHPKMKVTIVCDALYANTPVVNEMISDGHNFIINVKPNGNKSLFEFIEGAKLKEKKVVDGKITYKFRYINDIPLNDQKDATAVNFLECTITQTKGKLAQEEIKTFTWVTRHLITEENIFSIMQVGRARWKIENETFNTLKNQGYQFEHNFGHGKKHLTSVFAMLMFLAFLIDQIQEAACGLFQAAFKMEGSRRALWEKMRAYFFICYLNSWSQLFAAIGNETPAALAENSS